MITYKEEEIEESTKRISEHLVKSHKDKDDKSLFVRFNRICRLLEQFKVAYEHYESEYLEARCEVLKLEKERPQWIYCGFVPDSSGWYYTRYICDVDDKYEIKSRYFDVKSGWTPDSCFDHWLKIPDVHNV